MTKKQIIKIPLWQAREMLKDMTQNRRLKTIDRWKKEGYIIPQKERFFSD